VHALRSTADTPEGDTSFPVAQRRKPGGDPVDPVQIEKDHRRDGDS
jgi:hypothetical protein